MAACRELLKVGLAMVQHGQLLVVRKKGSHTFILPGGKPEGKERDVATLRRELKEELGCSLGSVRYEGTFKDTAADLQNTVVVVRLYAGNVAGVPRPASEIEEVAWISICSPARVPLAPSISNQILPHLCARHGGRSGRNTKATKDREFHRVLG